MCRRESPSCLKEGIAYVISSSAKGTYEYCRLVAFPEVGLHGYNDSGWGVEA
jgi:hypothetical protein